MAIKGNFTIKIGVLDAHVASGSGSDPNNSIPDSHRLFGLMSARPSTSRGFQHLQDQPEHKPDQNSRNCSLPEPDRFQNDHHPIYPGGGSGSQGFDAGDIDGAAFLVDGNGPDVVGGYVVESEPSKFKASRRTGSPEKSNGARDHFEVAFLPDFDAAGDGNLPEASFPPIDAVSAFGQPVDLEDIQVWLK